MLCLYNKNKFQVLRESTSWSEILHHIMHSVSFFDHHLINVLFDAFGTKADKEKLMDYRLIFQDYCKQHICELTDKSQEPQKKAYAIVLDRSLDFLTDEDLKKMQYNMNVVLGHGLFPLIRFDGGFTPDTFTHMESFLKNQDIWTKLSELTNTLFASANLNFVY